MAGSFNQSSPATFGNSWLHVGSQWLRSCGLRTIDELKYLVRFPIVCSFETDCSP